MAHEGVHHQRNRYEAAVHLQALRTRDSLTAKFGLKADNDFTGCIVAGVMSKGSWQENGWNRDFWLLKTNGTIVDDESADVHWEGVERGKDKDGNQIVETLPGVNQ
jgi:hypothetical protein